MLASGYLSRRWPAKYFHCYESLRPCSGWERVVSSCLDTSEFCCLRWKLHNDYKLFGNRQLLFLFALPFLRRLCNQRLLRSLHSRFVSNGAIAMLPCSSCPSASRHRQHRLRFLFDLFGSLRFTFRFIALQYSLHIPFALTSFVRLRSLHSTEKSFRKSPRPISISRLKMLPLLHL